MGLYIGNQETKVEGHQEKGAYCFGRRSWGGFSNQGCMCLSRGLFCGGGLKFCRALACSTPGTQNDIQQPHGLGGHTSGIVPQSQTQHLKSSLFGSLKESQAYQTSVQGHQPCQQAYQQHRPTPQTPLALFSVALSLDQWQLLATISSNKSQPQQTSPSVHRQLRR